MERPSFYRLPRDFHPSSQATVPGSRIHTGVWQPTAQTVSPVPSASAGHDATGGHRSGAHSPSCRQQHSPLPQQAIVAGQWGRPGSPQVPQQSLQQQNMQQYLPQQQPLFQQQVIYGSPASDAGLKSGDLLLAIGNKPINNLSHQAASDVIKHAGNTLDLTVTRNPNQGPLTPPLSPKPNPHLKPLPTSRGVIPNFKTEPQALVEQEKQIFTAEMAREREAVANQPYRTLQTVLPAPKTRHDYPTGSYLKYDPTWKGSPSSSPVPPHNARPDKLQQVMSQLASNVDPEKVVTMSYNSPINLYSNQNVAEALMPVTQQAPRASPGPHPLAAPAHHPAQGAVYQPSASNFGGPSPVPRPAPAHQGMGQRPGQGIFPAPAAQAPPPLDRPSSTDITLSPTYQLVQEMETGRDHVAVSDQQYLVAAYTPDAGHDMGLPTQSQSFNALTFSLLSHPRV